MNQRGLYIHVPFCEQKCPYCDFYSTTAIDEIDRYTEVVCKTLKKHATNEKKLFDTVYFGGGTPSLLGNRNLIKIMDTVKGKSNNLLKEVTLEMNPMTLPILDLQRLRENGINRLSIGLQSAREEELTALGRRYSVKDAENTIKAAKEAGFSNISLDIMLAIPKQSISTQKETIDFSISQGVQHISAYLLKIEKGTLFYKKRQELGLKSEDEVAEMYLFLVSELEKHGFKQYEISNFAKEGYKGIHNLKYWNSQEYLGVGPTAHSFLDGERFFYPNSLKDFLTGSLKAISDGTGGNEDEYTMLKLRLCDGLNNAEFKAKFGKNIPQKYFNRAKELQKHGLTQVEDETIKLTPRGFLLSNELISRIIF